MINNNPWIAFWTFPLNHTELQREMVSQSNPLTDMTIIPEEK